MKNQNYSKKYTDKTSLSEACCDVFGRELKSGKKFLVNRTASGAAWTPAFVQSVDAEKCTGCGLCVRVCLGGCYEIKEIMVNGKKKKVSVVVNSENCYGDCHCHKTCPVSGGAMVCKPK